MSELTVRFAGPEDAATVSSVLTEAALWIAERGEPLWRLQEVSAGAIAADVSAGRYVLAHSDGAAVGTARLTLDDAECWPEAEAGVAVYVHRLAVRRACAGRTAASDLLAWCGEPGRRLGATARYQLARSPPAGAAGLRGA